MLSQELQEQSWRQCQTTLETLVSYLGFRVILSKTGCPPWLKTPVYSTLVERGILSVAVIIRGNGIGDQSSNPGWECLGFILH